MFVIKMLAYFVQYCNLSSVNLKAYIEKEWIRLNYIYFYPV